jgi:hypothetical protein
MHLRAGAKAAAVLAEAKSARRIELENFMVYEVGYLVVRMYLSMRL